MGLKHERCKPCTAVARRLMLYGELQHEIPSSPNIWDPTASSLRLHEPSQFLSTSGNLNGLERPEGFAPKISVKTMKSAP